MKEGGHHPRLQPLFDNSPVWEGEHSGPGGSRLSSSIGKVCRLFKDANEHGAGQLSSLRVLIRWMVGGQ